MLLRIIGISLLLCAFTLSLSAQKLYTQEECKTFAEVYLAQSKIDKNDDQEVSSILIKHKIDIGEYRRMYVAQRDSTLDELSSEELVCLTEINDMKDKMKSLRRQQIQALVEAKGMKMQTYDSMWEKYQSDRAFRPQIQKYF